MLAWLVLLGGLLHAAAVSDIKNDTNYVIRQNASCSASGVFFQRERGPNSLAPVCYFCFCESNDTAVCWRRENRGCDAEHYRDFGKSNSRSRRSPLSLGEIFIRDAARDFFNKQSPEQCKPFESSFSDGCPPVDWCIGCTVCDCDANGRWDCHVLSFCPDKNGKKQMKKQRGYPNKRMPKRRARQWNRNSVKSTKITTKPTKKPTARNYRNQNIKRNLVKQSTAINKYKISPVKGTKVNKFASIKKPLPNMQAKKAIASRNKVTKRPIYIKKNVSTNKPLSLKSSNDKSGKNNTVEMAHKVVRQFMSNMHKMITNFDTKVNKSCEENKLIKKRSMPKPNNPSTRKYTRIRRQITDVENANNSAANHSYNWNFTNENITTQENNIFINNNIRPILNVPYNVSDKVVNFTLLKNSMDREIYITDNYIDVGNPNNIVKDARIYNSINNTYSITPSTIDDYSFPINISNKDFDVMTTTTNYSNLSPNFPKYSYKNNITDTKLNISRNDDDENVILGKEKIYSNASTQTEIHGNQSTCPFKKFLQILMGKNEYNNTIKRFKVVKTPKKYTLFNKIKRLFKKVFNKSNHKGDLFYGDHDLKQFDYKIAGHCKLKLKEKDILRQKMIELKSESENILRTIGIIKGLLKILEIDRNQTEDRISSEFYRSKDSFSKLNIILKTKDYEGENGKNLTNDQRTQINYIKDNVQEFIKSIGKFANTLDTIIQLAMCDNKRKNISGKINVDSGYNVIDNKVKDGNSMQNKLEKLKKLIYNYNVLQNKFINKIYVILNNLEPKNSDKDKVKPIVQHEQYVKVNKTDGIETNTANLFKNIRKLKLLIERNSDQNRRKRATVDDDNALEYLLILMEYLLKRHSPVQPSANDGLDLLIEAIKSAPDIKLIRKKVLDNVTQKTFVNKTTTPINIFRAYSNVSGSNTERTGEYSSNEISNISKNKIKTSESEDDDDEDDDKIEEIYRSFKANKHSSSEQEPDTLSRHNNISVTSESYYNVHDTTTRISQNRDSDILRNKAIDDSLEEELTTTTTNILTVESDTTSVSPVTDINIINEDIKNEINNSSINSFVVDAKANIDWIEENFKEIKQLREVDTKSSTPKSFTATRTKKHSEQITDVTVTGNDTHKENLSVATKENETYNEKTVEKSSAEEIMVKKQMNLLNSLDYVEDDIDSKDDKFLSDAYV